MYDKEKIPVEVAQGQGCIAIDILVPMEAVLLIYGLVQRQRFDLLDILADEIPVTCFVCKPKSAEAEKNREWGSSMWKKREASLNMKIF